MKSLIKFFPVALGVFALASCSNDQFFGSNTEDGKLELVATMAAPVSSDDAGTRNAIIPAAAIADYSTIWLDGDKFRVYDAQLQKYDEFSYKADLQKVTLDGDAKASSYAKAIFPAEATSYAGWDSNNDAITATMYVADEIDNIGVVKSGDKTAYVSNIPCWGDATMEGDHLKVPLQPLVAYTDIVVYQHAAKRIRVISAAAGKTNADFTATVIDLANLSETAPLSGYFDALLKNDYKDSYLVANYDAPLGKEYGYVINVDLSKNAADEAHVLIPIIAQKYDALILQYSATADGDDWAEIKTYENTTVPNNSVLRKFNPIGSAPITAVVSSLEDLNTKLGTIAATDSYKGKTVNITATGDIKTSTELAELTIPALTSDQIVNFDFPIDDTDNPLTITGGTADKTMTINLKKGISGNTAVTINTTGKLVLTGSITSSRSGEYKKLTVTHAQELTLGCAPDFNSFNTNMDIYCGAPLTIDAVEGEIAYVEQTANNMTIKSGKVTKVNNKGTGTITINGGEVTTIEKTQATGNVTISGGKVGTLEAKAEAASTFTTTITGGEVTTLNLAKCTGAVSITDAIVGTVDTKATLISIISADADATVTTLKMEEDANVGLSGDTYTEGKETYTAKISTLDANTKAANVTSTGKSVISTASNLKDGSSFNSTWNSEKIATSDITDGNIYTAAQLAGIQAGTAYTLQTDVTLTQPWTPVNLSGDFTAKAKTISGLNAPLFNKVSGTATIKGTKDVEPLALDNVAIAGAAKETCLGALAKEVDGTVTIQYVKVLASAATTISGLAEIGGLIGKASGTVTLSDVQIVDANLTGHANVGGFIGNVAGGSVNILTEKEWQSKIKFTVTGDFNPIDDNLAGTFGNFIGSITGAGVNVTIGTVPEKNKGNDISKFVDVTTATKGIQNNTMAEALSYNKNKDGEKVFKGMYGESGYPQQAMKYEIGYSPVTTVGKIYLYNKTTDNLGNPVSIGLTDINKFE